MFNGFIFSFLWEAKLYQKRLVMGLLPDFHLSRRACTIVITWFLEILWRELQHNLILKYLRMYFFAKKKIIVLHMFYSMLMT